MRRSLLAPVLEHPAVRGAGRNIKAFLRPYVGSARGAARGLRAGRDGYDSHRVYPENMVWIFGAGRTGSTWIAAMIAEMKDQTVWFEPRVGDLFNLEWSERYAGDHFILGSRYREVWLRSVRNFVLDGADARFPGATNPGNYLMIKEPGGSIGAPLLMEALPESRMVLLVRDPRDVAASWLDAGREGGWQNERRKEHRHNRESLADRDPDAFTRRQATAYLQNVGNAKKAYDAHAGRKSLVRYEDLRADTPGTMRRMYRELGMPVDEPNLGRAVEKHSWEAIPKNEKGEGKFYRKAKPGGWQEDLTPRQARIVERITGPLIEEFYPDSAP